MSKFEEDAMELIETVAENSRHNVSKPFLSNAEWKINRRKISKDGHAPREDR